MHLELVPYGLVRAAARLIFPIGPELRHAYTALPPPRSANVSLSLFFFCNAGSHLLFSSRSLFFFLLFLFLISLFLYLFLSLPFSLSLSLHPWPVLQKSRFLPLFLPLSRSRPIKESRPTPVCTPDTIASLFLLFTILLASLTLVSLFLASFPPQREVPISLFFSLIVSAVSCPAPFPLLLLTPHLFSQALCLATGDRHRAGMRLTRNCISYTRS